MGKTIIRLTSDSLIKMYPNWSKDDFGKYVNLSRYVFIIQHKLTNNKQWSVIDNRQQQCEIKDFPTKEDAEAYASSIA